MLWTLSVYKVEWLQSLSVFLICSPFYSLMSLRQRRTELAAFLTHQEETGISACLHSFQYVEKSKRERGSLIKRHVSNPLSGWEEIFLMKCNTLPNCAAAWGAQCTFQRESMLAFQMQYLSIETACEREQRQERSISVMMCEKGKLLAQHVLFLITFHLAIFHLMQNKQLEMQCDDIQPSVATVEPAFPRLGISVNTRCRLRALVALAW